MEIKNKKALFNYEVIEKLIAGIVLTGTEIKSIREGKASLVDTYCFIKDNEVWLKNSYIKKFDIAAMTNHEERRDRKLLLSKQEIKRWKKPLLNPGITIVPLKMFINQNGLCKVELCLCKGKKEYDKRESIKEQDNKRELDRIIKSYK
jgi:SsrA-binding protein